MWGKNTKKILIASQNVFTACSLLARSDFALLSPDLCTNPKDLLLAILPLMKILALNCVIFSTAS